MGPIISSYFVTGDVIRLNDQVCTTIPITRSLCQVWENFYGYGLFTGGLGAHIGAELIGTTVLLISGGLTRRQVQLMEDLEVTVIAGTPSYTLVVAETAAVEGVDLRRRMKIRVC